MDFYTRAKELADSVDVTIGVNKALTDEFNIRSDEVSRRFKSFFGKNVTEYITDRLTPSKEEADKALILCNNVDEFKQMLGIKSGAIWKGFLDKYYGVSTFTAAKTKAVLDTPVTPYRPTREDNLSILVSQVLGDGSFDKVRSAFIIDHKADHIDYLMFKVGLLKAAYPFVPGVERCRKFVHSQGHEYVNYYAGGFHKYRSILTQDKPSLVKELTPLGWLLWYLDDGGYYKTSEGQHIIQLAAKDDELCNVAIQELATYGYNFSKTKNAICLKDAPGVAKFINGMIHPFYNLIPECMMYKCDMKV